MGLLKFLHFDICLEPLLNGPVYNRRGPALNRFVWVVGSQIFCTWSFFLCFMVALG